MGRRAGLVLSLVAGSLLPAAGLAQYLGLRVVTGDPALGTLQPGSALGSWQRLGPGQPGQPPLVYSHVTESASQLGVQRATGLYQPLSRSLSSLIETSHAGHGELGSEWSVLGQVGARLGEGWGVQAGLRHSETGLSPGPMQPYAVRLGAAQLGMLTLEHTWDSFRSAYTLYGTYYDTGASGTGHRLEFQYYYSQRSNIGLSYTAGHQLQAGPAFSPFAAFEGNNLGVTGEHWIGASWAVNYRALVQELGPASGLKPQLRFGLRYTF